MSKIPLILKNDNAVLWTKNLYGEIVDQHGGPAAVFTRIGADGSFYKSPSIKLSVITLAIKNRLSGITTRSTSSSSTSSTASNNESVSEPITYDVDMFSTPFASLEVVSQARFDAEVKRLEKAQERADKFDEEVVRKKPSIWIIITERIDLETLNKIKSKSDYLEKYNDYDVVWYFKTALQVKVISSNGVPQVDFVTQQNQLFNVGQFKTESGPQYYERVNNLKDNYLKLCNDRNVIPLDEKYLAAYFLIGLNDLVHAEFKNSVTNNAKSGILAYPVTIADAYQRVTDFRPTLTNDKKSVTGPVSSGAAIFTAADKCTSGKIEKGSKAKTPTVTVANRLKKSRERLKKKSRVDSQGVTRWIDSGDIISCNTCKKKNLPDNHFDINCPEAKRQLDDVIAESKKKKNAALSESIFMVHSHISSCPVHHVMSASSDLTSNMVLLDNQASISMVNNPAFLTNIRRKKFPVLLQGATGTKEYWLEGDSKNFGVCLLNRDLPCQIISYFKASKSFPIDYNQQNETFTVKLADRDVVFTGSDKHSMYIHVLDSDNDLLEESEDPDMPSFAPDSGSESESDNDDAILTVKKVKKEFAAAVTVAANESQYSKREVEAAKAAVELQRKLAFASERDIHEAISNGAFTNLSVTNADLRRARDIYGSSVAVLKGKSHHEPPPVYQDNHVPKLARKNQEFHGDLMFVDGLPFLIIVVSPLEHVLVTSLKGKSAAVLLEAFTTHIKSINQEGFQVKDVFIDGEGAIAKITPHLQDLGVAVHASPNKVPKAERKIQTIKNRVRSVVMDLPFPLCRIMMVFCVLWCVSRLNLIPTGVNGTKLCSTELLRGRKTDAARDLRYSFGDLVESPVKNTDNDVNHARTDTCIVVASTGSINGDHKLFKPFATSVITRPVTSSPLPMTNAVIQRMTDLWLRDGDRDPTKMRQEPRFAIGRPDRDVIFAPDDVADADDDARNAALHVDLRTPAQVPDESPLLNPVPPIPDEDDDASPRHTPVPDPPHLSHVPGDPPLIPPAHSATNSDAVPLVTELRGVSTDHPSDIASRGESLFPLADVTSIEAATYSAEHEPVTPTALPSFGAHNLPDTATSRYGLRSNRSDWRTRCFLSSQYSRKQAEIKFGDLAVHAKMKELLQMRDLEVMYPVNFHTLSREQRRKIIRSHMIFQPKYDPHTGAFIKLKARFVADGSTQDKTVYDEADISSPTVTTHAVFINAAIAAKERRIVKVVDLPGAYLHADMSGEEVLMHINKEDAQILIMLVPSYEQYRRTDGSMIVKLTKALYGCIESARLWYREISTALKSIGYISNVKDICVFNKMVNGVQCTITLHVDDLMVTSVTEALIDEVMNLLRSKYERPGAKLDVKEGTLHNYLGMTFDFSVDGEVKISMNKYITEVLQFTGIKGHVATPATTNLYSIVDSDPLDTDEREYFHSVVAKLLYLSKRVRPDLLTAVGFLAKRVTVSTKMDTVKLERVLRYLNGTPHLGLTLRPDENLSISSYIDASYAVHHDMKSQTGVAITLGEGITYSKSTTQQLNSKSSTEAELIALTDAAGHVIWVRDYLIGQGYNIGPATIFQDNMSTMALVKKGYSTSNNTRHINIRYFFIKDRVDTEELKIEYLPTEDMIADFFTKPLQGELFKTLRDKVLGVKVDKKYSFITCF